jgi:hypothetical protein
MNLKSIAEFEVWHSLDGNANWLGVSLRASCTQMPKTISTAGVVDDENTRRQSNSPYHLPLKKVSLWVRHF